MKCKICNQDLCPEYPKGCSEYNECIKWLSQYQKTKNIMHSHGTYHMKHIVERLSGKYIPMNSLVHAAVDLGFIVKPNDEYNPSNFCINISKKCINDDIKKKINNKYVSN